MDKKALEKARSRLRVATKAAGELAACKDHNEFTDTWYTFLTASKNIYTILEQGAKVSPQSRQWFGAKAAERRSDDLLQYVYEARNDDEHGLEPITERVPASLSIGAAKPGFSKAITINGNISGGAIHVISHDGNPVLIERTVAHSRLAAIRARGGRLLQPPTSHFDEPLPDSSPITVSGVALRYLSGLVQEAAERAA